MFIGFVLALILSLGAGYLAEYVDPSFRTPEEVTETLSMPVLASLPRKVA
jgi:capsular polysaccharide biosynthesis protein